MVVEHFLLDGVEDVVTDGDVDDDLDGTLQEDEHLEPQLRTLLRSTFRILCWIDRISIIWSKYDWLIDWLIDLLIDWYLKWFIKRLTNRFTLWLCDLSIDLLIGHVIHDFDLVVFSEALVVPFFSEDLVCRYQMILTL